jgi:hypothetical protein
MVINRFSTQEILEIWESNEPYDRSTKVLTSEMLSLHEDSKGALIDNKHEYGSPKSLPTHSFEDNSYINGVS